MTEKDQCEFEMRSEAYVERFQPRDYEGVLSGEKVIDAKLPEGFKYPTPPSESQLRAQERVHASPEDEEAALAESLRLAEEKTALLEKKRKESVEICKISGHVWAFGGNGNDPLGLEEWACRRCDIPGVIVPRAAALRSQILSEALALLEHALVCVADISRRGQMMPESVEWKMLNELRNTLIFVVSDVRNSVDRVP